MSNTVKSQGFTVIETLLTLIIAVIFILSINVIFISVIKATSSDRNRNEASNLAYNKLRKYAYAGATPSWFTCPAQANLILTPAGTGQVLEGPSNVTGTSLPSPVTSQVTAYAPYGCSGSPAPPVLVRSDITYGPDNIVISHATYVGYTK